MTTFQALLTSLPTGNSTIRMRVWRALKSTGCGVLRDGVYLLPAGATGAAALLEAEADIKAAGGFAMIAELAFGADQLDYVRKLFDRTKLYGELLVRVRAAQASLKRLGKRKGESLAQRLRTSLDELVAIDFFPGPSQSQAKDALSVLDREVQSLFSASEPSASKKTVRRLDPARYRNCSWVTRSDLWMDRLACVWLIRRFIDKGAKFVWIDRARDRRKGSVGFDFDGAEFTHSGNRVTFEVLLTSFGLDADSAFILIGHVIHFLDIGGIPAADAQGLETIMKGIKAKAADDDELSREAGKVFDLLYSAYSQDQAS